MTTLSPALPSGGIAAIFRRASDFLDARGKGAWIAAMILAFVFVWPVGLFILGYMIWSKRMFGCRHDHHSRRFGPGFGREAREEFRARMGSLRSAARPTGNAAFDSYKADTLRRLEDEQEAFETFLHRLREAKDKQEFDSFMEDRARAAAATPPVPDEAEVKRPAGF